MIKHEWIYCLWYAKQNQPWADGIEYSFWRLNLNNSAHVENDLTVYAYIIWSDLDNRPAHPNKIYWEFKVPPPQPPPPPKASQD